MAQEDVQSLPRHLRTNPDLESLDIEVRKPADCVGDEPGQEQIVTPEMSRPNKGPGATPFGERPPHVLEDGGVRNGETGQERERNPEQATCGELGGKGTILPWSPRCRLNRTH